MIGPRFGPYELVAPPQRQGVMFELREGDTDRWFKLWLPRG
jgi:hypothetical protein